MLKRTLIAAATAAALAGAALATAAPSAATEAGFIQVSGQWPGYGQWQGNGQWNGPGQWHGGDNQWRHGKKKFKHVRRSCEPIIRWVWGHGHHKKPIVVGWRCDRPRHHNWNPYW